MGDGFERGDVVDADFGHGYVVAFVARGAYENDAGETKYGIQSPDGQVVPMAHREESDVVAFGLTFKRV